MRDDLYHTSTFKWEHAKIFTTAKLKELLRPKSRVGLPLYSALKTPSLIRFRWTVVEKWSRNASTLNSTCKCDDLYLTFTIAYFHSHNSSMEGAMKLKLEPFCSSCDALSDGIIFRESQNFQFQAKNHGL